MQEGASATREWEVEISCNMSLHMHKYWSKLLHAWLWSTTSIDQFMSLSSPNLFTASCCLVLLLGHATVCQGSPSPRVFPGRRRYISWADLNLRNHSKYYSNAKYRVSARVILVSKDGTSDSTTVQGAVDMVPNGNNNRVKILISPGVYRWFNI